MNKNALNKQINEDYDNEPIDLESLEEMLQNDIDEELSGLEFLEEEREKIGSPENLGEVIKNVVWDQFMIQIAATAGEDFVKENCCMSLDLRKEAHIQTTENFANGKIASHNTNIDYQKRYDDWQSNFKRDENGNILTHKTRSGTEEATLVKGARKPFDEGRPTGSVKKGTDMDHTVSAGEIIRDPAMNAHLTKEEQIKFANSEANLNELDSSLNRSKGDKSMKVWLDTPNANGQKPEEIFDISKKQKQELLKKDAEARKEKDKTVREGEQRSIEAGKKSRRDETLRIGGKAARAVVMQMLAELMKEIIGKLVKWFKMAERKLITLIDRLKEAITSFVGKIKKHLLNAANTVVSTIATAIWGPVVSVLRKVWTMLKQGAKSLKEAIDYIKDPANRNKSFSILMLEVGKIIMAGLSGIGAIVLGEVIEKGLLTIPVFAVEIPLLGSLANIIGIFLGAVIAGIVGAIAINWIEKKISKKKKEEMQVDIIHKGNEIINKQMQLMNVKLAKIEKTHNNAMVEIGSRHAEAAQVMRQSTENIAKYTENVIDDATLESYNTNKFDSIENTSDECDDIFSNIEDLLGGLN